MKRKILSILLVCLVQASLNASTSNELGFVVAVTNSAPATIEELEGFLRGRSEVAHFPEVGFASFKHPFLTKKYPLRLRDRTL